jgi:hypothetical protein
MKTRYSTDNGKTSRPMPLLSTITHLPHARHLPRAKNKRMRPTTTYTTSEARIPSRDLWPNPLANTTRLAVIQNGPCVMRDNASSRRYAIKRIKTDIHGKK